MALVVSTVLSMSAVPRCVRSPMLIQVDALPCSQCKASLGDGQRQRWTHQGALQNNTAVPLVCQRLRPFVPHSLLLLQDDSKMAAFLSL
jgi:hypothetical protein